MLDGTIKKVIFNKINDLNKNPEQDRDRVHKIISTLNDFIYYHKELSDSEIKGLIAELTFFTTLISTPLAPRLISLEL